MQIDYEYLCQGLGHLTGLEARVYKKDKLLHRYSHFDFDPDIAGLVYNEIQAQNDNAFYVETEYMLVFGVIKSKKDKTTLILGPTSQIRPERQDCISVLYTLGEPYDRLPVLQDYFTSMIPYPFENFLEILCFVNYAVNDEKLTVPSLIRGSDRISDANKLKANAYGREDEPTEQHNTYQVEKQILSFVTSGDVDAVQAFFQQPPTGRVGSLAANELRQRKNTFICAATLISRAAIAGASSQKPPLR